MTFSPKTDPVVMLVFDGIIKLTKKGSKKMRSSKFSQEQIAFALKQAETGTPVKEVISIHVIARPHEEIEKLLPR